MRGKLTFESSNPALAASRSLEAIERLLRELQPVELERQDHSVAVRTGIDVAVSNGSLLSYVSELTVQVTPSEARVEVTYDVRLTGLIVICACLSVAGVLFGIWGQSFPGAAFMFVMTWVWLFGMTTLGIRSRITSALRKVAEQIVQEEAS